MNRLFVLMLSAVFLGLFLLIPNNPGTAYPIPTPLPPISDGPEYLLYGCSNPSYVLVGWWQPPPEIPPFSFGETGSFVASYGGSHYYYNWTYLGIDEWGWHLWEAYYPRPPQNAYTVNAYVRNVAGNLYWVLPYNQQFGCGDISFSYLPMVVK